jgi:rRNA maturation protein Nop10
MSKKKEADAGPQYTFEKNPRCPACGSRDSTATSTQGRIQYRKCRRVGCYHLFHIEAAKLLPKESQP